MDNYLLAIGWWNFAGSIMMLGFYYQPFGKQVLNEWTKIFKIEFALDYWGKLWMVWASGLNIFFGLINIMSVKWAYPDVQLFLIGADLTAYIFFILLAIWGIKAGRLGSGFYSVLAIFTFWITWGIIVSKPYFLG